MDKVLNVTYASSLTNLCELNSSFDIGTLRICYAGQNRNGSFISYEAINKSLKTIYNCPIVCNYNRETDSLGGHDIEVVHDANGGLRIVNVTQPVGVIPESSRTWYEEYEEDDGTIHKYLCAEVLLWKRQEAYRKIKQDGITSHSMEITVKDGRTVDGIYHIEDFEFTAFALIGVEPCFEGSALELFSKQDFKQQLSEMMQDLKEGLKQIDTSDEVDNTKHQIDFSTEGGEEALNEQNATTDELKTSEATIDDTMSAGTTPEVTAEDKFALTSNVTDEIRRILEEIRTECEWGEWERYWYVDCDFELNKVYCWDTNDWLLYGFTYTTNGDSISIDFESKKRMKYVIAEFDEGEQLSPFAPVFTLMEQKVRDGAEWESKYQSASETITSITCELDELRKFKDEAEETAAKEKRDSIFSQFEDLNGIEAFDELREKCMEYDIETLEEKCYAIRGRNGMSAKFSYENKAPKLKVVNPEKTEISNEPYGGVFTKYGIDAQN